MAPFNLYNSNMFDCYSHHAHLLIGAIFSKSMLSNLAKVKWRQKVFCFFKNEWISEGRSENRSTALTKRLCESQN